MPEDLVRMTWYDDKVAYRTALRELGAVYEIVGHVYPR